MRQRNRYDSFLIWLYSSNKAHLIPENVRHSIPHSTASTWRKVDYDNLIGHELRDMQLAAMKEYELLNEHRQLKRLVFTITKVWLGVSALALPLIHKTKENQLLIADEVQRLFGVMPRKIALKLFGFSASAFSNRMNRIKRTCGISPLNDCFKRHPLQLAQSEVRKIKRLFTDESKVCWPVSSLYYHGLRNKSIRISLSTFYKYVNLLGLKRQQPKPPKKTQGIKAAHPNQFLHVDTTKWELANGMKANIVFVTDNYSRAILGWSISMKNNAENVIMALRHSIKMIQIHHPKHECTTLMADGGGENHSLIIDNLLSQCSQPSIIKIIAQKDIRFSNSSVEAINRTMKKYLRHHNPQSESALWKLLPDVVRDYNHHRPHISLNGLMPMEAYTHPNKTLNFSEEIKGNRAQRIQENQQTTCKSCQ